LSELRAAVIVVGAGAAGLWAAAVAARGGAQVLLLEKTARTGTKVLASGGTRCNLTTTLGPEEAARLFRRRGERFLRPAFRTLPPLELRRRFALMGVATREAPLEKVFPASDRARDVRDALERETREAGVRIELSAGVRSLAREEDGWLLELHDGRRARCAKLLLCAGGASYARSGTTGEGYAWLASLGLKIIPPVPALVPLTSPATWVGELAGVALQEGEARLVDEGGHQLGRRSRPLLFTHTGISGPAAMDLSVHVARARGSGRGFTLIYDPLPELVRAGLREHLIASAGSRGAPSLARALQGTLPRRLLEVAARQAGIEGDNPRVNELSKAQRHELIEALRGLRIPIDGTLGFDRAEVTAGGLDLAEVEPRSMRVRSQRDLWVFGELLDLDGPIGGLNFQAAFACAELAGRDVAGS
jgi:predicted Rossmann fold flavoprotein